MGTFFGPRGNRVTVPAPVDGTGAPWLLDFLAEHGSRHPSALITNVKLAGRLTGWQVAKRIREKAPSFPVVYVNAHDRDWPAFGVPNSIVIPKPFAAAQLVTAISNLLNAGTPQPT